METAWDRWERTGEEMDLRTYTIRFLDAEDSLVDEDGFTCSDESEALAQARLYVEAYPAVEVWDQNHRVARIAETRPAAPPPN